MRRGEAANFAKANHDASRVSGGAFVTDLRECYGLRMSKLKIELFFLRFQSRRTSYTDKEIVHWLDRNNIEEGECFLAYPVNPPPRQSSSSSPSLTSPADQQHLSALRLWDLKLLDSVLLKQLLLAVVSPVLPLYIVCNWLSAVVCMNSMLILSVKIAEIEYGIQMLCMRLIHILIWLLILRSRKGWSNLNLILLFRGKNHLRREVQLVNNPSPYDIRAYVQDHPELKSLYRDIIILLYCGVCFAYPFFPIMYLVTGVCSQHLS
jgi:hypothetical protein